MNGVLARQMIGRNGEQEYQRKIAPAKVSRGRGLGDRDPAGIETHVVSAEPATRRENEIPEYKPDGQHLAAALDHGAPRPWGFATSVFGHQREPFGQRRGPGEEAV